MRSNLEILWKITAILPLILLGCGCSAKRQWEEEVKLSDGSLLLLSRTIQYEGGHGEIGSGSGWIPVGERMNFADPASGRQINWQGSRRVAAYLDRANGEFLIIAAQSVCGTEREKGQPLWKVYRSTPTGWSTSDISTIPAALTANLALESAGYRETENWTRLNLADKRRLDDQSQVPRYRRVISPQETIECH